MIRSLTVIGFVLCFFQPVIASADIVCLRINRGRIEQRTSTIDRCARGYTAIINTNRLRGADGSNGVPGTDGALRVWGDESDGDVTFPHNATILPDTQFRNVMIPAGATVYVRSGTTIRATGWITIAGKLVVLPDGNAARIFPFDSFTYLPLKGQTYPGIAKRPALYPECTTTGRATSGGIGGTTIGSTDSERKLVVRPTHGGGSGAGNVGGDGGGGGGAVAVQAYLGINITNTGAIVAEGEDATSGAGGGAGGVIILASNGLVQNSGQLNVSGGDGGPSTTVTGAGGGGGGGMVRVIAPSFNNVGATVLTAGAAGSTAAVVSMNPRCGGAGGGGAAGTGGTGADVAINNAQTGPTSAQNGALVTTIPLGTVEALLL